jgi:PadR family transcriptional regulator AphA
MDDLSPTARAILGLLTFGPNSGYDIKSFVDKSVRFFWAASYGSIYPELKRLQTAGLVAADGADAGGRRRTMYSITDAGRERIHAWLVSDEPLTYELRDEGLLKLFFASSVTPGDEHAAVAQMRARHQEKLDQLRSLRQDLDPARTPSRVLAYGLALHEFSTAYLQRLERELAEQTDTSKE